MKEKTIIIAEAIVVILIYLVLFIHFLIGVYEILYDGSIVSDVLKYGLSTFLISLALIYLLLVSIHIAQYIQKLKGFNKRKQDVKYYDIDTDKIREIVSRYDDVEFIEGKCDDKLSLYVNGKKVDVKDLF